MASDSEWESASDSEWESAPDSGSDWGLVWLPERHCRLRKPSRASTGWQRPTPPRLGPFASGAHERVRAVPRVPADGALQLAVDYYDYASAYVTEYAVPVMSANCAEPTGR